jgi:hypothetical protein
VNARLDRAIGVGKMNVATLEKLVIWYQVDRDHPDAQQLQAEWCGNRTLVSETSAQAVSRPSDVPAVQAASAEHLQELTDKTHEYTRLMEKATTLLRQLRGMGFSCPTEPKEAVVESSPQAPPEAGREASGADSPATAAATGVQGFLGLLDVEKGLARKSIELLEPSKRLLETDRYNPAIRQNVCLQWKIEETMGVAIEVDRKWLKPPPEGVALTADERQSVKNSLAEVIDLRSDLLEALDYFTSHGITCPATDKR